MEGNEINNQGSPSIDDDDDDDDGCNRIPIFKLWMNKKIQYFSFLGVAKK